ncbi:hypothetical protein ACTU3I_12805 [Microbacterium sp. RD1]|uniref:hypothetical protein n=1 Tax=Microbacterium sp. RD1 TaxID=3457313 RepID=UPI003FA5A076
MAFLNMATLEEWVGDFRRSGREIPGTVNVITQDGADGADTGLVSASLASVSTVLFIEPREVGAAQWRITFEPRDTSASMDADTVRSLADELLLMADLCSYLEDRAREHVIADAP